MRITVHFFAVLRERAGKTTDTLDVSPGTTAATLYTSLFTEPRPPVGYAVNQAHAPGSTVLQDGDEVVFLPPIGGG